MLDIFRPSARAITRCQKAFTSKGLQPVTDAAAKAVQIIDQAYSRKTLKIVHGRGLPSSTLQGLMRQIYKAAGALAQEPFTSDDSVQLYLDCYRLAAQHHVVDPKDGQRFIHKASEKLFAIAAQDRTSPLAERIYNELGLYAPSRSSIKYKLIAARAPAFIAIPSD